MRMMSRVVVVLVGQILLILCLVCQQANGFVSPSSSSVFVVQKVAVQKRPSRWVPTVSNRRYSETPSEAAGEKADDMPTNPFKKAVYKFKARPGTYMVIPFVAAFVGWLTNWMAVQMIFYPVGFWGIPIYRVPEVPLGLLGWQGIVPCKTRKMSEAMVHMVTTQLLSVQEVFAKLNPTKVARLLAPQVPKLTMEVLGDLSLPPWIQQVPGSVYDGLSYSTKSALQLWNIEFLKGLTRGIQKNVHSVFDLRNCVVNQMLQDRSLLGQLFRKCGEKELDFLTNSGLWFGFLLGLIQMGVALFWENPWSLSIGGAVVGYATNWLALKWIFEPVNPTRVGPFVLQGQFLRRQKEVAKEFSSFFANKILTSQQVWNSILTDPATTPAFGALFGQHFRKFVNRVSFGVLRYTPEPETVGLATRKALERLPQHVGVLHEYIDNTLGLQETLRIKMEQMSSVQFERVLHPIFEEDELTLILAGAALGFAAGLIQQGIETGQIQLGPMFRKIRESLNKQRKRAQGVASGARSFLRSKIKRIRQANDNDNDETPAPEDES